MLKCHGVNLVKCFDCESVRVSMSTCQGVNKFKYRSAEVPTILNGESVEDSKEQWVKELSLKELGSSRFTG